MQFYIVAFSLPRDGYFFTVHKHGTPELCKWTEADRSAFFRFREIVQQIYEAGPARAGINREDLEILHVEGMDAQTAVSRVLPYYITCFSPNKKRILYPERKANSVEVLGPAGTQDEPFGLRLAVIAKGTKHLHLKQWVLDEVSARRGTLFTEEEAATLEGRSDRTLVEVVAGADRPCVTEGTAKIVALPAEANVRLTRTHLGEFISEIPRVWA